MSNAMAEGGTPADTPARDTAPAPLRDAATVVLVRDGDAGIEVFLQRRVKQMAFAGGMTVFPGGGVDPRDADADLAWTGPEPQWWAERFATSEQTAQALVCAAVRETFEECGVLLASSVDGVFADPAALRADRQSLVDKSLSFAGFLATHGLVLRADLLRPLAHWITPQNEKRRYDTRFYLAAVPAGQEPDGETSEADTARWVRPQDALDAWRAGRHFLLPPTWSQLTDLAGFETVDAVLAATRTIEPIEPVVASDAATGAAFTGLRFPRATEYFAGLGNQQAPDL
ncbi:NUDIX domain-containing protein [Gordonia sinesedis]